MDDALGAGAGAGAAVPGEDAPSVGVGVAELPPNGSWYWSSPADCASAVPGVARAANVTSAAMQRRSDMAAHPSERG